MFVLFDILKALLVRGVLGLHALVAAWRVTVGYDEVMYWLMTIILVTFVAEGVYTIIRRKGSEYQRFMPCFFFYLCTILPCIWLLELDKTNDYILSKAGNKTDKYTTETNQSDLDSLAHPEALTPGTWVLLVEEMMPYFLFITRWLLPRGRVTREQLAELLFAFIGIGGDIMEFFSLLGEVEVRANKELVMVVLAIWSFSVLQFTMTITVIHQPKRQRNINVVVAPTVDPDKELEFKKFRNEMFAIILTMFMQDLPFMIVRLYTMIGYGLVNYSLIFFTSKNIMIIGLLLYKICIITSNYCNPEDEEEEDDDGESRRHSSVHSQSSNHVTSGKIDPSLSDAYNLEADAVAKGSRVEKGKKNKSKATKGKPSHQPGAEKDNKEYAYDKPPPNGLIFVNNSGLAVNAYIIPNSNNETRAKSNGTRVPHLQGASRSGRSSPLASKSSSKGSKGEDYIEIEHTTPRGDESHDSGLAQRGSGNVSLKSSEGNEFLASSHDHSPDPIPKQTPSTTPKQTPSTTPKHTPSSSISSLSKVNPNT
ncbi:unnamed protein product [Lymnaea stagnalis]|uniref:Transmembrane protein 26 n=1 Tax=Lymnaea stagnalis TaxID=6523 RepID=A0AAV2H1B3_LYMST